MAESTAGAARALRSTSRSVQTEVAFRARLEELGAVLHGPYLGTKTPHPITCAAGHECTPRPTYVLSGGGVCRICAGQDSEGAWKKFRARVEELGGTVLEPKWLGNGKPHRIRCPEGHVGRPYPNRVAQGGGICGPCGGNDPATACAAFRAYVEERGGRVLEPVWLGAVKRHTVVCAEGHEGQITPAHTKRRKGLCRVCSGNAPGMPWKAFRDRIEEAGATMTETAWLGAGTFHKVVCPKGHACRVKPSKFMGVGVRICAVCAGTTPEALEARFRKAVEARGGTVLEPYHGAMKPHRVRCSAGHECTPTPHRVLSGEGLCRFCAGKTWDVFYVTQNDVHGFIKFGITSGDPRPRLGSHARDGFTRVIRLHENLPGDAAPALERRVLAALRDTGEQPVRGREYFSAQVLPLVLACVNDFLGRALREAL